jgi:transcriptional regulator with XRE-family HTH domain
MGKQRDKKALLTNRMIYANIKYLAKERKMTLTKISNDMGKSDSYLSATFSKKENLVSLELVLEVASILQCRLEELIKLPMEKRGGDD